jgi:hypothetical protein
MRFYQRLNGHGGAKVTAVSLASISIVLLLTLLSRSYDAAPAALAAPVLASTSEKVFRREAVSVVRPLCSPDDVPANTVMVGVASVSVATSGRVLHVDILEAPSDRTALAMSQALAKWRFKPREMIDHRPVVFSGKVTLYFARRADRCDVAFPEEVGYVGRWKDTSTKALAR